MRKEDKARLVKSLSSERNRLFLFRHVQYIHVYSHPWLIHLQVQLTSSSCLMNAITSSVAQATIPVSLSISSAASSTILGSGVINITSCSTPLTSSLPVSVNNIPMGMQSNTSNRAGNPFVLKFKTALIKICQSCTLL